MKLVFAIVNNEDGNLVMRELNRSGFQVTKMASTGGFLRSGNTTLLVGATAEEVRRVVEVIEKNSMKRKQVAFTPEPYVSGVIDYSRYPDEIETGGATIFIVDVERFEKI